MLQDEFDSLTPARAFSRRDFVRTGVGTGFAAAVLPTLAQTTITTD
ncbi:MAG: carboxymethylenebutenolidase, partial [Rubrivivax sp.]|nr:carboxymethylenebutenolidase [Rubrivivax sp.]